MMNKDNNPAQSPPSLLLSAPSHDFMSLSGPSLVPIIAPEESTSTFLGQSPDRNSFAPVPSVDNSFSDFSSNPNQMSVIADSFGFDPQSVANIQPIPTYSASQFPGNQSQMQPLNPPPIPDNSIPASLPLSGSNGPTPNPFSSVEQNEARQPSPDWMTPLPSSPSMANSNIYRPAQWHWFFRSFDCSTLKGKWTPFSPSDSCRLEMALVSGFHDDKIPTNGGRYDCSVAERLRYAVYWDETPTEIRRCLWFFRPEGERDFTPYDEGVAQRLEGEYIRTLQLSSWHRRLELPSDSTGRTEVFVFHNPQAMVHYRGQTHSTDEFPTTAENSRPCVVRRGLESLEVEVQEDESQNIDHVIFVVHGIGERCDLRGRSLVQCVDDFRMKSNTLVKSHFISHNGRVEYLPVHWHGALHGEATGLDIQLKKITLGSIPKLRSYTNDTLIDILFYTSPKYCQTIINTVASEINRLHVLFNTRNPQFHGQYSIAGHSLGSVIAFDLLANQGESKMTHVESKPPASKPVNIVNPRKEDTSEDVSLSQMLNDLQLPQNVMDIFEREQIDMDSLSLLSDNDLKEMEIPLGPRKKIKERIKKYPEKSLDSSEAAARGTSRTLLARQDTEGEIVNFVLGTTGIGQPLINYPELDIKNLSHFFALGSPIALFLTTRGLGHLADDFHLPTCPGFFNIFHPFDPVAYRMETMVLPHVRCRPVLIPHHKGRKRMHLELKDSLTRIGSDIKSRIMESLSSTWRSLHQFATGLKGEQPPQTMLTEENELVDEEMKLALSSMMDKAKSTEDISTATEDEIAIGQINQGRRFDYVLQESPLESFNDYIFALSSHACYWESEDTALMLLKETYLPLGIHCQMPSSSTQKSFSTPPPPMRNSYVAPSRQQPNTQFSSLPSSPGNNYNTPPPNINPLQPPSIPPPVSSSIYAPPPPSMPPTVSQANEPTGPFFPPPPPSTNQSQQQSVFGNGPLLPRHGSLFRKK